MDQASERLSLATARGDFSKTPFGHVLIYISQRKLSGTLEIYDKNTWHAVYFNAGSPAKARLGTRIHTLGEILINEGVINEKQLESSVDDGGRNSSLIGSRLVEKGYIDPGTLITCLKNQLKEQLVYLFGLRAGPYGFFQGVNRLRDYAGEELIVTDPYEILMEGLRKHGDADLLSPLISKIENRLFYIKEHPDMGRFNFTKPERRFCRNLSRGPASLDNLPLEEGIDDHGARVVLYALLATGFIKIGEPTVAPSVPPEDDSDLKIPGVLDTKPSIAAVDESEMDEKTLSIRNEVKAKALSMASQNYFEMLGVDVDAPQAKIRKAFFELAKKFHPDKCNTPMLQDLLELYDYIFTNISEAHNCLINPDSLERYKATLDPNALSKEEEEKQVRAILYAEGSFQNALVAYKKRDFRKSKKLLEETLEKNPEHGDCIALYTWIRAMERGTKGKVEDLIRDMEKALDLMPKSEQANFFMAMLLKRSGLLSEAVNYFEKTVEINPQNVDAAREIRLILKQSSMSPKAAGGSSILGFLKKKLK